MLAGGIALLTSALTIAITSNQVSSFLTRADLSSEYSITLNNTNQVSAAGDVVQHTAKGSNVTFTYANVASYNSGHTKLNNGGTIVNKDQITSISAFTANFSGTGSLKARISYVPGTWNDYFELVSGQKIALDSHPYYLEMKADSGYINLNSAVYEFTCVANSDAEPQDTEGSYDISFKANGSDSSTDIGYSSSALFDEVESGSSYISSFGGGSKIYAGSDGLKFGSSKAAGDLIINFDSSNVTEEITTIDIATAQYGTDTGNFKVYVNDSSSYTTITPSDGGEVAVNGTLESLTFETTSKRAYLCGLSLHYGSTSEPGAPDNPTKYSVGFTADDSHKNEYTTNSIFANDNGLTVAECYSDGTTMPLSSDKYTYVVKNSSDVAIDTTAKFPAEGVYSLIVSYNSYIPITITLNVGEYVYMTDVSASMSSTTFNTADTLSNNLASNLTANIEYSNGSMSSSISYADFDENDLGVKLITPKGITYDITKVFGTAGIWTVKVYDKTNEEMYYNISITVNAIPVQTITLNETSYSLYPEDTLQLVASVNPNNATNQEVNWTSNNEAVATVSDSGLVTAIAVGGATITATADDGSNVYGTCAITVVARPATTDYDIDASTLTQVTTNTTSSVVFTNSPVTVTIGKGSSSTNANNYVASGNNPHTRVYSGQKFTISAGDNAISEIVIHGTSDKGVSGFTTPTWTNASKSADGYEVTLTPTDPESSVSCTISGTSSFSGITVTVGDASTPVYPTSISLSGTSSIAIGSTSQLSVNYSPSDTNVKNVTFASSNTSVATVSNSGLVTGVAQGNATITATAETENGTTSATLNVTITPVAVNSVSLDSASASVKEGKTVTLVATVYPTNATNKSVNWSSSSTSVATVNSSGVVTGVAAGNATITVTTVDGNKTAQCVVTVTASSGEESFSITYTDLPTAYQTNNTIYTADSGFKFQAYNCANYSSKMQFKASSGYLQSTEDLTLQSLTIHDRESNSLTVYGSNTAGSFSTVIEGTKDVYDLTGYSYFRIARTSSGAAYCSSITVLTGTPTPTDPTSIILSPTSAEVGIGGTKQIGVSYVPSNANQNKEITWTSSNTSVATVSSTGLVSVKSTATSGQTATITARLTNISSIYETCTITVVEQSKDDHTVLIYMCGADLESSYASSNQGLATGDLKEILSVSGQPDDVNIVVETGGASKWSSTYGISSSKLERWHVENRSLVKDASLTTYTSMGATSTLQSFIEYGLTNYPAERTGLIFWNHGGAMTGVCFDEKSGDDSLLTNEVSAAVSGALSNCGMSGQKLEWVGYDACLMQVQDIASINSDYFNYMIASEESESGYGWDYDTWVDDLYAKKTTPVIMKAIVDGFIKSNGGTGSTSNDQTLSYLDLSYMSAYITAWNNMASQLNSKITTSNKSSFNSLVGTAKHYADDSYIYYGIFDAKDFVNKLSSNSTFNPGSSYTSAVLTAHSNLVAYSSCGAGAGNSYGLCMFWAINSKCYKGTYYTSSMTKFTTWRTLVTTYGN